MPRRVGVDLEAAFERSAGAHRKRFLDALYRQYSRMLIRFISKQNITNEEAREVVQETYCRLHQVPTLETLASPKGYLFRTAINLAHDIKRQRRHSGSLPGGPGTAPTPAELPSEAPAADRVLSGEQELAIIRRAIAELSPTCRQVFLMHRFDGATYRQIAERHGLSVSMIEKHVSQALAHLKSRLDEAHGRVPTRLRTTRP